MIYDGSSWCDLVKHSNGRVEFVHLRGVTVICEEIDRRELWSVNAAAPLLYLRAAADGNGRVCAIGVGNDDGNAWATIEGGAPFNLGAAACPFPVLIFGDSLGWVAFIQKTTGDGSRGVQATYDVVRIHSAGGHVTLSTREMAPTSQGFLYVADGGSPVTQDRDHQQRLVPGLTLPSLAGDVWVGQSTSAPTLALYDSSTNRITPLTTPGGQPPHIVESGGTYYVCSYVAGGAWLSTHRRPFAAPTPPPVEPPPVIPPKEPDVSVRDVPNLIHVIEQCKRDYPTAWKNCHRAELSQELSEEFARRAAYACSLEDPRFGLNGKRGNPNDLSDDCVCFKHDDGRESVIDFGGGAGGDNPTVQWSIVGHYQVPGPPLQLWIRAERVGGGGTPNPGTPTPPVTPPASVVKPFPAIEVPWDVDVRIQDIFIAALWKRDRIEGRDVVPSRGAEAYRMPVMIAEIVKWVNAHDNRAPQGMEWWPLAETIGAAAAARYRQFQGPDHLDA